MIKTVITLIALMFLAGTLVFEAFAGLDDTRLVADLDRILDDPDRFREVSECSTNRTIGKI